MPFRIAIKPIIPKKTFSDRKWQDEVAKAQRTETFPKVQKLYQQTFSTWSHKPSIGKRQTVSRKFVSILVYPYGPNANIYNIVSSGVAPHKISGKQGGLLHFREGYKAATRPGTLMSSKAYRFGKWRTQRTVTHHIEARNFYETIGKEHEPQFKRDMQEAINRAARS